MEFRTLSKEDKIYNLKLTLQNIELKVERLQLQKAQVEQKIVKLQQTEQKEN